MFSKVGGQTMRKTPFNYACQAERKPIYVVKFRHTEVLASTFRICGGFKMTHTMKIMDLTQAHIFSVLSSRRSRIVSHQAIVKMNRQDEQKVDPQRVRKEKNVVVASRRNIVCVQTHFSIILMKYFQPTCWRIF